MDPRPWIALSSVPGVGRILFKRLVSRFGSPEEALRAPVAELQQVEGARKAVVEAIKDPGLMQRAEEEIERAGKAGARILLIKDEAYPASLREIHDPPPCLYVRGSLLPEDKVAVAIVGTRTATTYGRKLTYRMSGELAEKGVTIVSGGARGIDTEAHQGALAVKGRTIAVLGCGIDVTYPPENRKLYEQIAESGALVSEYPVGTPPESRNFPPRNRIISGASMGVVVIEAAGDSGSLITASFAMEQGREVYAVPGNVVSPVSRGTNSLIKKGARLVEDSSDILLDLFPSTKGYMGELLPARPLLPQPELKPEEKAIFDCIKTEPLHIDSIVSKAGINASRALSLLLDLELRGIVKQIPGMRFVKDYQ